VPEDRSLWPAIGALHVLVLALGAGVVLLLSRVVDPALAFFFAALATLPMGFILLIAAPGYLFVGFPVLLFCALVWPSRAASTPAGVAGPGAS
jgi:hypothetical protein